MIPEEIRNALRAVNDDTNIKTVEILETIKAHFGETVAFAVGRGITGTFHALRNALMLAMAAVKVPEPAGEVLREVAARIVKDAEDALTVLVVVSSEVPKDHLPSPERETSDKVMDLVMPILREQVRLFEEVATLSASLPKKGD